MEGGSSEPLLSTPRFDGGVRVRRSLTQPRASSSTSGSGLSLGRCMNTTFFCCLCVKFLFISSVRRHCVCVCVLIYHHLYVYVHS
jgi:hypothetical protein